jgi:hypothetical protein
VVTLGLLSGLVPTLIRGWRRGRARPLTPGCRRVTPVLIRGRRSGPAHIPTHGWRRRLVPAPIRGWRSVPVPALIHGLASPAPTCARDPGRIRGHDPTPGPGRPWGRPRGRGQGRDRSPCPGRARTRVQGGAGRRTRRPARGSARGHGRVRHPDRLTRDHVPPAVRTPIRAAVRTAAPRRPWAGTPARRPRPVPRAVPGRATHGPGPAAQMRAVLVPAILA